MSVFDDCTKLLAAKAAHALPEEISTVMLMTYCFAEMTQRINIEHPSEYLDAVEKRLSWAKQTLEAAGRRGKVLVEDAELNRLYIYYIRQSGTCDFVKLTKQIASAIECNEHRRVPEEKLLSAEGELRSDIYRWLDGMSVERPEREPLRLASSSLKAVFKRFTHKRSLFIAPDIPIEKLTNATNECGVPESDHIHGLIDCTFWGSAKHCVVVGERGLYHSNRDRFWFLSYADILELSVQRRSEDCIRIGSAHVVDLSGAFDVSDFECLLDALKEQAFAREQAISKATGLSEVAGMSEIVRMLQNDVLGPLKDKAKYLKYGLSIPNGLLMYGPPGCGKTYLARGLAKELGYNFQEVIPSTLASPYIHETVSKIEALFSDAEKHAPTMVFVDEVDGLIPSRDGLSSGGEYKAEEVNEWLTQIALCAEKNILFVAATNFPWKLDPAAVRSGRIDRKIFIGPPQGVAMLEMLSFHLKNRHAECSNDLGELQTELDGKGYSSSDLKLLVDEAARLAMQADAPIGLEHLRRAASSVVRPSISDEQVAMYMAYCS